MFKPLADPTARNKVKTTRPDGYGPDGGGLDGARPDGDGPDGDCPPDGNGSFMIPV